MYVSLSDILQLPFFGRDGEVVGGGAGVRFSVLFCFSMKLFGFGMHEGRAVLLRNS